MSTKLEKIRENLGKDVLFYYVSNHDSEEPIGITTMSFKEYRGIYGTQLGDVWDEALVPVMENSNRIRVANISLTPQDAAHRFTNLALGLAISKVCHEQHESKKSLDGTNYLEETRAAEKRNVDACEIDYTRLEKEIREEASRWNQAITPTAIKKAEEAK